MSTMILSRIMNISPVQRQSMITLFWQIVFTALGFISTIYFAHAVGANVLGAYFLFMAYYGFIGMVADGGIGGAALKRISENEEADAFFTAFLVIRTIFIIFSMIVLVLFREYLVDLNNSGLYLWFYLLLLVSSFEGTVSIGVAGRGKMGVRSTCNAITRISTLIFQVIGIYMGFGAAGLVGGTILGMLAGSLIEFHFLDLHLTRFRGYHIKSLFIFSFWLFLTSGGVLVFSQADTILIGYFMKNSDVGIYRVILQFTTVATFTTYALKNTLWPRVSQWGKSCNTGLVEESLARAISYSLILAVPVLAGGILLGDKLLYHFYGTEFASGYIALVILLIVQLVNVFQFFFTTYLDALNFPKESFKVTIIAASANILLDIILIPVYGIEGAAAATLVSMILNAFLARRSLARIIKVNLETKTLFNILKASAIMTLFIGIYIWYIPLSSLWLTIMPVVLGGIIFGVALLKSDKKVYDDIKTIALQLQLP
ncbi:MAG: polysaccharide biosynthesis protein [Candidatus Methanoperedenaceae archaeon]|nr:MAG: polysaccharide biosynthesis protein [Candidatus Methanoperedenaceae archaeon]